MSTNTPTTPPPPRLMSLDALRGFDMFWIVGADGLVNGLARLNKGSDKSKNSVLTFVQEQLEHVAWQGFHFEDLIFPMFVFIAGVSLVFSLSRNIEQHGKARRGSPRPAPRLCSCMRSGIFYYGGFSGTFAAYPPAGRAAAHCPGLSVRRADLRLLRAPRPSRLLRRPARRILALMAFVPVPGGAAGDFAEGKNLANWVDANYSAAAEMGRRSRSRRPAEHAAGDRQLPVGRFRRACCSATANRRLGKRRCCWRLPVAVSRWRWAGWVWNRPIPIPVDHQEDLDLVVRFGGLRIQQPLARRFLSRHRRGRLAALGRAFRLDRREPDYHLRAGRIGFLQLRFPGGWSAVN